jgi:hypothetical protein
MLTHLTNAFSRKWENLKAALALYFFVDALTGRLRAGGHRNSNAAGR